jgi:hypothetical protein
LFYVTLSFLFLIGSVLETLFLGYLFGLKILVSLLFYSLYFFFESIIIILSLGEYALEDLFFSLEEYCSLFNYRIIHVSQNWVAYLICTYKGSLGLLFLFNFLFVIIWVSWFIYLLVKPVITFAFFYLEEGLLLLNISLKRGGLWEIFYINCALTLMFLVLTSAPALAVGNPLEGYVRATLYMIKSAVDQYPEIHQTPLFPENELVILKEDFVILKESSDTFKERLNNFQTFLKENQYPRSRRFYVYKERTGSYAGVLNNLYAHSRANTKGGMVVVETVFGEPYPLDRLSGLTRSLKKIDFSYVDRYNQNGPLLRWDLKSLETLKQLTEQFFNTSTTIEKVLSDEVLRMNARFKAEGAVIEKLSSWRLAASNAYSNMQKGKLNPQDYQEEIAFWNSIKEEPLVNNWYHHRHSVFMLQSRQEEFIKFTKVETYQEPLPEAAFAGTIFEQNASFPWDIYKEDVFRGKYESFLKQETLSLSKNKSNLNILKRDYSLPETSVRHNARVKATYEYQSKKLILFKVSVVCAVISSGLIVWELSKGL